MTVKEAVIPNFPVIATAVLVLGLSRRITEEKQSQRNKSKQTTDGDDTDSDIKEGNEHEARRMGETD